MDALKKVREEIPFSELGAAEASVRKAVNSVLLIEVCGPWEGEAAGVLAKSRLSCRVHTSEECKWMGSVNGRLVGFDE